MARHFCRLKLTLLAASFRRGWQPAVGVVLGLLLAIPTGVFGAIGLALSGSTGRGPAVVTLALSIVAAGWVVLPPLAFGLDETLDPARLALLPIPPARLVVGLLAGAAVGIAPLWTLLVIGGAAVGLARAALQVGGLGGLGGIAAVGLIVAAGVAQFVLCLLGARALTTALSSRLASRRGQDLAAVGLAMSGLFIGVLGQIPNALDQLLRNADPGAVDQLLIRGANVAGALPIGWAGRAMSAAAAGQLLIALGWLAAVAVLLVGLARWWARGLARALETSPRPPGAGVSDRPLFPRWVTALPRNRVGAAAAKELRYFWAVPQWRAQWMTLPVLSLGLILGTIFVPSLSTERTVLVAPSIAVFYGFGTLNAFGADRAAVWLLIATGPDGRADLAGKNLAGTLLLMPIVTVTAISVAAITGGWQFLLPAIAGGLALLGVTQGVGNVTSVLAPLRLPDSPTNVWSQGTGAGCATGLIQIAAIITQGLLALPAVVALGLTVAAAPGLMGVAAIFAVAWGIGVWWGGLSIAAAWMARRGPEFVAALSGGAG